MAACKVIVILALAVAVVMAGEESVRPKKQVLVGSAGYPYAYAPAAYPAAYSALTPAAYSAYPAAYPSAYSAYSAYPAGYYGAQPVVTYA